MLAFCYKVKKEMYVKVTVIARVLSLVLTLVNQRLSNKGVNPILVDESTLLTMAEPLNTTWKDDSNN